jgi:hypothetical protein
MKKGISVILALLMCSTISWAQSGQQQIKKQIDKQYVNKAHQQFMYTVSPLNKELDDRLLDQRVAFEAALAEQPNMIQNLPKDTTWSYSENKGFYDDAFTPASYTHYFQKGDTNSSSVHFNQHVWYPDSMRWSPNRIQTSYVNESHFDSVITYFYQGYSEEPYTGNRSSYPRTPAENADYEEFWDYYEPGTGWIPSSRRLAYRNEMGWDTLSLDYSYDRDSLDYYLSYQYRNQQSEDYSFYEYTYFNQSGMTSQNRSEDTPDFSLSENKSFDWEGNLSYWSWDYLKKLANGAWDYQLKKVYSFQTMELMNEDSTAYIYNNDNTIIESESYYWDSLWVYDQLYKSFQTEIENGFRVDSIHIYDVDLNEETMLREPSRILAKNHLIYDAMGNQVEVKNFTIINDSLQVSNKIVREYSLVNDYYTITSQESYAYDFNSKMLFKSSVSKTNYVGNEYRGFSYFNLNAAGDTTYGYINQYERLPDGSTADVRFDWDWQTQKLVLRSYRINGRQITGDDGRKYNQYISATINPVDGSQAINRSMNGYNAYPGVFSDGPIYIEMGDTLNLYVSARSPDMSIPEVEVSNLPATATYDPETRHIFWVVDDLNPGAMTYKATRGDKYVTAEVEFINENFSVENEENSSPYEFELSQNYPNPFNPSTNISFTLPEAGIVSLKVYNVLGQEVATLANQRFGSGSHSLSFDASLLSSGVYIYRLQAGNKVQTKKMLLVK